MQTLAAIMFTDIEGYTALMQEDEQHALSVRHTHRTHFNKLTEPLYWMNPIEGALNDIAQLKQRPVLDLNLSFRRKSGFYTG